MCRPSRDRDLSTALSIRRVKEAGLRQTLGSSRFRIFFQFILESVLVAVISLLIAIVLLQAGMSKLQEVLNIDLILTPDVHLKWLPVYMLLAIFIGCVGGWYPATLLARLKPHVALKGKAALLIGGRWYSIRKAIILFQFFVTAALIVTSFTVRKQIKLLSSKDLGFDKENVVIVHVPDDE